MSRYSDVTVTGMPTRRARIVTPSVNHARTGADLPLGVVEVGRVAWDVRHGGP